MDSRLELCSGAGMSDIGRMQQDRAQHSSARTRQGRDAQGRRRRAEADGRPPAAHSVNQSIEEAGSIGEIVALVSVVD